MFEIEIALDPKPAKHYSMIRNALRCDSCGRFIKWAHIADGTATHRFDYPSCHMGDEEYTTLCVDHTNEQKARLRLT